MGLKKSAGLWDFVMLYYLYQTAILQEIFPGKKMLEVLLDIFPGCVVP